MPSDEQIRRLEEMKKDKRIDEKLTRDMMLILSKSGLKSSDIRFDIVMKKLRLKLDAEIARGMF